MPVSLGQLAANRAHCQLVTASGVALEIDYRPGHVTLESLGLMTHLQQCEAAVRRAMKRLEDDPDAIADDEVSRLLAEHQAALDSFITQLSETVITTDLCEDDEDGKPDPARPVPFTPERLRRIDLPILSAIFRAIQDDQRLGERNGTPSSRPSVVTPIRAKRAGSRKSAASRKRSS